MTPEEIETRLAQCEHDEQLAARCEHNARFAKLSPLAHRLGEVLEEAATALRWWTEVERKRLEALASVKPEEPPLLEAQPSPGGARCFVPRDFEACPACGQEHAGMC